MYGRTRLIPPTHRNLQPATCNLQPATCKDIFTLNNRDTESMYLKAIIITASFILISCTQNLPSKSTKETSAQSNCILTCDNKDYVIPGNKHKIRKVSQHQGEEFRKKMQLVQKEYTNQSSKNALARALNMLNEIEAGQLTNSERAFVYEQKSALYLKQESYAAASDELLKILKLSPEIPVSKEAETYKTLSNIHFLLNDKQQALQYYLTWVEYQMAIMPMEYAHISKLYEETGNLKRATANFARALELKKSPITTEEYQHLKSLYEMSGDLAGAQRIEAMIEKPFKLNL
jgi:tetratricopeptide (TPR) repeat protein